MSERGVSLVASLAGGLALLAQATHGQPSALVVGDQGIGGLTAETPLTVEAISAGLGLPVKKATTQAEGVLIPVYEATRAGKRAFWIIEARNKGHIGRVVIFDLATATRGGTMVGTDWTSVYARAPAPSCKPGKEEASGMIICPAPGMRRVTVAFAGKWDGPDGTVPPPEILAKWTAALMIWQAD